MFEFLRRRPTEIATLLARIDAAIRRLPVPLAALGEPLLRNLSSTVRKKWNKGHDGNYAEQIRCGETHEAFIYNFLVHAVGDKLESGQYHVYRGVLSDEGRRYLALFEHAISTMIEMETYTAEWAHENLRKPVMQGVEQMG